MKTLAITYIWWGMPEWERVIRARPEVVVLNPNSGPGSRKETGIINLVNELKSAGIKVIGYVHLSYGERSKDEVISEAAKYFEWYGLDGIFWDEAPTNPLIYSGKYRGVHGFARKQDKSGISVFNPGVKPGALATLMTLMPGSIWITFEGPEWFYQQSRPQPGIYKDRQAHIVYGLTQESTWQQLNKCGVGWGFATPDDLPNPYDTWPTAWYN